MPFPDGSFDAVFMCFTLELFDTPEISIVLAECRRALRPGGRVCVVALIKKECSPVRVYEWFHQHLPDVIDCRPIYARRELESSGFIISNSEQRAMWGLPVEIVIGSKPKP